jgi:hypothetical protein
MEKQTAEHCVVLIGLFYARFQCFRPAGALFRSACERPAAARQHTLVFDYFTGKPSDKGAYNTPI